MNNIKQLEKLHLREAAPIIYGVVLIKTFKMNTNEITTKDRFLKLINNSIKISKFDLLPELEKWISLQIAPLNSDTFFSIFNLVNKFTVHQLLDFINNAEQNKPNDFYIRRNKSINELTIAISNVKANDTFLDPTATPNGPWLDILKKNPKQKMFLQTVQPLNACLIYLNVIAIKAKNVKICSGNILNEPKYVNKNGMIHFDRIINIPPFGMRFSSEIINNTFNRFKYGKIISTNVGWGFASNAVSSLKPKNGKAIIILPNGDLFGKARRRTVRNNLINDDKIKAVISLPEGFFPDISIQTNVLIFDNQKNYLNNKILFIDANQPEWIIKKKNYPKLTQYGIEQIINLLQSPESITNISQVKSISDCQKTLMVNKYVLKDNISIGNKQYHLNIDNLQKLNSQPLRKVASVLRGYNLIRSEQSRNSELKILRISDIVKSDQIDYSNLMGINKNPNHLFEYQIHKNDIIFSIRGSIGKVIFIQEEPSAQTIISSNLAIIRSFQNPTWLYLYLRSLLAKYLINKSKTGSTVSIMSISDLRNLMIPIVAQEKQKELTQLYDNKKNQIMELEKEIQKRQKEIQNKINAQLKIDKIFKAL